MCGSAEIAAALERGEPLHRLLVARNARDPALRALCERAKAAGAAVDVTSERELWRLSPPGQPCEILAVVGPTAAVDLHTLMQRSGAVWLFSGVAYAGNVGFALRTLEVAGAAGAVVDAHFEKGKRRSALRIAMGAQRFFPVLWKNSDAALEAARAAERRIIGIEDSGRLAPWEADLSGAPLFVVGGEQQGIAASALAHCDLVLRLPMAGFIPSYNLQAAVAATAIEHLRQTGKAASAAACSSQPGPSH